MTEEPETTKTPSRWKDWLLIVLGIYALVITWWTLTREKSVVLEITGTQLIIAIIIISFVLVVFFRQKTLRQLPDTETIMRELRESRVKHKERPYDTAHQEVIPISDFQAWVHLPQEGIALLYDSNKGFIGKRQRDVQTSIRDSETHKILEQYARNTREKERTIQELEKRGYEVNEE